MSAPTLSPAIQTLTGCLSRVVLGTGAGTVLGALVGLLLNAYNNNVLAKTTGASYGSYVFWVKFFALMGATLALPAALIWAVVYGVRRRRVTER